MSLRSELFALVGIHERARDEDSLESTIPTDKTEGLQARLHQGIAVMPSPGSYNDQVWSPQAQIRSDLLSGHNRFLRTNIAAIADFSWNFLAYSIVESTIEYLFATIYEHLIVIFADGFVGHFFSPEITYDVGRVDDIAQAENDHWRFAQLLESPQSGKKFAVDSRGNMVNEEEIGLELNDSAQDYRRTDCLGFLSADAKTLGHIDPGIYLNQGRHFDEIDSLRQKERISRGASGKHQRTRTRGFLDKLGGDVCAPPKMAQSIAIVGVRHQAVWFGNELR
jgi:hypothetical protein